MSTCEATAQGKGEVSTTVPRINGYPSHRTLLFCVSDAVEVPHIPYAALHPYGQLNPSPARATGSQRPYSLVDQLATWSVGPPEHCMKRVPSWVRSAKRDNKVEGLKGAKVD